MTNRSVESANSAPSRNIRSLNLDSQKLELLQNYLNGSLILGTFVFFINLYFSVQSGKTLPITVTLILFAVLFAITFLRRMNVAIRVVLLFVVYFGAGIFSLITNGLNANGILYFFIAVLMTGILTARKWWIPASILSGLTVLAIGMLFNLGFLKIEDQLFTKLSPFLWISTAIILFFLVYLVTTALFKHLSIMTKAISDAGQMEQVLTAENENLSLTLESQHRDQERRNSLLLVSRQITREISGISTITLFEQKTTELIQSQFGYRFVGIYLSDDNGEFANLQAGSSSTAQLVSNQNNRIRISDDSIVGSSMLHGESRISQEIQNEFSFFQGSQSAEIQSELVLPLRQAERIIGTFDFQSDKANAFDENEIEILQTLVEQFTILFEKLNQLEKLQGSVIDLENASNAYSEKFWDSHLRGSRKQLSYQYLNNKLETKSSIEADEIEVLQTASKLILPADPLGSDSGESTLLVPIRIRNQTIGVLKIKYQGKSVPRDLEQLIDAASARLSSSIENARLLEEIQEQANREKMVSTITNKVRSATNIDAILQTTVTELGRTLGINEVRIQLKAIDNE